MPARSSRRTRSPPGSTTPASVPSTAHYKETGRAEYVPATDGEALDAFVYLARMEGIIPAFESAHAIAELRKRARVAAARTALVLVNVSGRGDKDVAEARRAAGRSEREPHRRRVRERARRESRRADRLRDRRRSRHGDHGRVSSRACRGAGADIVELGMPHSDPIAEGPTIQASSQRALEGWWHAHRSIFDLCRELRRRLTRCRLVFMGYANNVLARGEEGVRRVLRRVGCRRPDRRGPSLRGGAGAGRRMPRQGRAPDPARRADESRPSA